MVADVFADLRATLGVPFVNLIWRHLATLPGVLEPAWTLVKPLQASALLQRDAAALRSSVTRPDSLQQPACVFDAVGVPAADRAAIRTLLRGYNAANAANLLSLLVVSAVLDGHQAPHRASPAAPTPTPKPSTAGPRLPGLDELPPATLSLVLALDQFGRLAPTEAVASLYRHLGHWPGFLAVVHARLLPQQADGSLRREHEQMRARAGKVALDRLLPVAAPCAFPADAATERARTSVRMFTDHMIARMVVMGELMLATLPQET